MSPRDPAVRLGGDATLAHLARVLDDLGIERLRVHVYTRQGQARYCVVADTADAEAEAVASDLAEAIQDALGDVLAEQRTISAAVGS